MFAEVSIQLMILFLNNIRNEKHLMILVAIAATITNTYASVQTTLSGRITDSVTGEALPGVSVYFPDLKLVRIPELMVLIKLKISRKSKYWFR